MQASSSVATPWGRIGSILPLVILAFVILYFFAIETGANLQGLVNSNLIHEFVHDARHAIGIPCH
jgi:hypothetical protein